MAFLKSLVTFRKGTPWCDPAWDIPSPKFKQPEWSGNAPVRSQEHGVTPIASVPAMERDGAQGLPASPVSLPQIEAEPTATLRNDLQPSATNDLQNWRTEEFAKLMIGNDWDTRTMKERGELWKCNASTASRWITAWEENGLIEVRKIKRRKHIKMIHQPL